MNPNDWITENRDLPHPDLASAWSSILGCEELKERLMNQAILTLRLRQELPFSATALHGLLLLVGRPGTGKTTLARGIGHELAPFFGGSARLIEVNPHGLMSGEHGQSQQHVFELLCEHVPMLADDGRPTILVLDEVESMAVARSAASLSANPADVHRATDAVLMALDRNARTHPHLLTIATSNFAAALDAAFISRADLSVEMPLPDVTGIRAILEAALIDIGERYSALRLLAQDRRLERVAGELTGLDGRRIRKVVVEALAGRRETVVDPNALTIEHLSAAAHLMRGVDDVEGALLAAA